MRGSPFGGEAVGQRGPRHPGPGSMAYCLRIAQTSTIDLRRGTGERAAGRSRRAQREGQAAAATRRRDAARRRAGFGVTSPARKAPVAESSSAAISSGVPAAMR
jgi:hypothetical protein